MCVQGERRRGEVSVGMLFMKYFGVQVLLTSLPLSCNLDDLFFISRGRRFRCRLEV